MYKTKKAFYLMVRPPKKKIAQCIYIKGAKANKKNKHPPRLQKKASLKKLVFHAKNTVICCSTKGCFFLPTFFLHKKKCHTFP